MNYKTLQLFKLLSLFVLLLTIGLTIWAYFKMDSLFNTEELKKTSSEFQLFVLAIITGASTSFFVSWRLILVSDVANAEVNDSIDDVVLEKETVEEDVKKYSVDWNGLFEKSNISKFPDTDYEPIIQELCRELNLDLGMVYKLNGEEEFENVYNYAYFSDDKPSNFKVGEGLHGQVVKNMQAVQLKEIPKDYIKITSASGFVLPRNIYMIPIINEGKTVLYFEFADMKTFNTNTFDMLNEFVEKITNKIF